jgi:cytochrome c peroxidase
MEIHFKPFLKKIMLVVMPLFLLLSHNAFAVLDPAVEGDTYALKLLGKYVFFDKISEPERMACVTCHVPETGGTGGNSGVNLHQVVITGANPHTRGNLKPPTNAYASLIEAFQECDHGGLGAPPFFLQDYCGGNFWSGRSEGKYPPEAADGSTKHIGEEIFYKGAVLDTSLLPYAAFFGATADQALNPMPNVVEQNKARQDVCLQVEASDYAPLYETVWGEPIDCSSDPIPVALQAPDVTSETEYDISFKRLMLAVGAWQSSKDLNSFSSKRDNALASDSDGAFPLDDLTCQENYGHDLFYAGPIFGPPSATVPADRDGDCVQDKDSNGDLVFAFPANCAFCHANGGPAHDDGTSPDELYTAQDYHKIDVPFNPEIPNICDPDPCDPFLQPGVDEGIKSHLDPNIPGYPPGFFKTPTVRNVDKRKDDDFIKAYMHNGYFKSLERVVHFYNTAAVLPRCDEVEDPSYEGGLRPMTDKEAEANNCWPAPEFGGPGAVPFLVGRLGLTPEDEAALVAYMKTLTDLDTPVAPLPYKGLDNVLVRESDDDAKKGGKKK